MENEFAKWVESHPFFSSNIDHEKFALNFFFPISKDSTERTHADILNFRVRWLFIRVPHSFSIPNASPPPRFSINQKNRIFFSIKPECFWKSERGREFNPVLDVCGHYIPNSRKTPVSRLGTWPDNVVISLYTLPCKRNLSNPGVWETFTCPPPQPPTRKIDQNFNREAANST